MSENTSPGLTDAQKKLLAEIDAAGVLYVNRYGRFGRTVGALVRKGVVKIVEHDYSPLAMNGYSRA